MVPVSFPSLFPDQISHIGALSRFWAPIKTFWADLLAAPMLRDRKLPHLRLKQVHRVTMSDFFSLKENFAETPDEDSALTQQWKCCADRQWPLVLQSFKFQTGSILRYFSETSLCLVHVTVLSVNLDGMVLFWLFFDQPKQNTRIHLFIHFLRWSWPDCTRFKDTSAHVTALCKCQLSKAARRKQELQWVDWQDFWF